MMARNLFRFKLVSFDLTDTLLKFKKPPEIHYVLTARRFGISLDENLVRKHFRIEFKSMVKNHPNFGANSVGWRSWWNSLVVNIFRASLIPPGSVSTKTLETIADELIEEYKSGECWTKVDCADEILTEINNQVKTVGVLSNFDPRIHCIIKDIKLPRFDFVISSYETGFEKPDQRIFRAAERYVDGIKPEECLHIGNDVEKDFEAAKNAGWSSVLIHQDTGKEWKPRFDSISEFYKTLKTNNVDWN